MPGLYRVPDAALGTGPVTAPTTAGLWVRSERMPSGAYGVAVSVGEDVAFTLAPAAAQRYALGVLAAATTAEHEAAIVATIRGIGGELGDEHAVQIVGDVRADRPPLAPAGPFQLATNVTRDGGPLVAFRAPALPVEDFAVDAGAAREHATAVLTALVAADLDATVLRVLRTWGIDEHRAAGFVAALARHWPNGDGE